MCRAKIWSVLNAAYVDKIFCYLQEFVLSTLPIFARWAQQTWWAGVDKAVCALHDTVQCGGLPSPPVCASNNGNSQIWCGEGVRDDGGRTGTVLFHPVIVLSCTAILLAIAIANKGGVGHDGGLAHDDIHHNACRKYKSDDDRNVVAAVATLPHFWWGVLDISTEDN